MIKNKKSLGRGLKSLIPSSDGGVGVGEPAHAQISKRAKSQENTIIYVPLARIKPNPWQPRSNISEEALSDLINSIKERGILLPLIVTEEKPGEYQIIAGERRLRAAKALGLGTVPVVVKKVKEEDKLEVALIENIQRQNLNPIDEARAYARLKEKFGLSQDEIARKVGRKRSTVANSLRLLTLPNDIQHALAQGLLTQGHAKILLGLTDAKKQYAFFRRLAKNGWSVSETENRAKGARRIPKSRLPDAEISALQDELQTALATKVRIARRGKSGRIHIDFYSFDELKNIINRIINRRS